MNVWMPAVAEWLIHSALAGGVILLFTGALMKYSRQPALKQRLGEWGLASALVAAGLAVLPAWWVLPGNMLGVLSPPDVEDVRPRHAEDTLVPVVPAAPAEVVLVPQPPFIVMGVCRADDGGALALPPDALPPAAPLAPPPTEQPAAGEPARADAASTPIWFSPERLRTALTWLVVVYVGGCVLFVLRLALAFWWLHRLVRRSMPAPPMLQAYLADMTGWQPAPRLLISPRVPEPVSFGLFRPTIVLPIRFAQSLDAARLRWVFTHELTHLQRRDAWSGLLCALAQTVFYFLPWCWSICRHVRLCQEYIADASAIGEDQEADYAEFLLSLTNAPAVPLVATGVSGSSSDLFRRVTMLMEKPIRVESRCSRRWLLMAAASLLGLAVVVSGVGLAQTGRRTIIIIEEDGKEAKDVKKQTKKVRVFVVPGGEDVDVQKKVFRNFKWIPKIEGDGKKIVIIRRAGQDGHKHPVEIDVKRLVKDLDIDIDVVKNKGDKKVKVIAIKVKDGKVIPITLPEGAAKKKRIRIRIQKKEDGKGKGKEEKHEIEIELKLDGSKGANSKAIDEALKKLGKVLGKDEVDRLRNRIKEAIQGKLDGKARLHIVPHLHRYELDLKKLHKHLDKKTLKDLDQYKKAIDVYRKALGETHQHSSDYKKYKKQYEEAVKKFRHKWEQQAPNWRRFGYYQIPPTPPLPPDVPVSPGFVTSSSSRVRLGVQVEVPSGILADQLNLPKGKGLVITQVVKGTPAAKAGLKANDVLLKLDSKNVSSNHTEFVRQIGQIKNAKSISAVVLRKGKRQTIKGIKLAKQQSPRSGAFQFYSPPGTRWYFANPGVSGKGSMMSIMRDNNKFNASYVKGRLSIAITGTVQGKKATANRIAIRDGGKSSTYDNVKDVPKAHRAQVNRIIEIVSRGAVEVESSGVK